MTVVPGVELDEVVDLSAEVACDVPACDRTAAWLGTILCPARHTHPLCAEHHRHEEKVARLFLALYVDAQCMVCDALITPPFVTWRPL